MNSNLSTPWWRHWIFVMQRMCMFNVVCVKNWEQQYCSSIPDIGLTLGLIIASMMFQHALPANLTHEHSVCLILGQRRRRWTNIKPTLGEYIVFSGLCLSSTGYQTHCTHRQMANKDTWLQNYHYNIETLADVSLMLSQCCFNVAPPSATVAQH